MKVESRGKFPGVKLHLEPEEIEAILIIEDSLNDSSNYMEGELAESSLDVLHKMFKKLKKLKEDDPTLLQDRTPEQVQAILVKEVEKATMQLQAVMAGQDPAKIDKSALKEALLKYVKD